MISICLVSKNLSSYLKFQKKKILLKKLKI